MVAHRRCVYPLLLVLIVGIAACLPSGGQPTASQPTASPASVPTRTPFPSPVAGPNDYIVIAQLNMWYFGPGPNGGFEHRGKRSTPLTPALGSTYVSSDASVIRQQIDWAADYGVDAFSLEWTTPRGVGHSLEDNIDDYFLNAPNLSRIRWCIFDDFVLRLDQTPGLGFNPQKGIDFDDPAVYKTFVDDFDHFAEKYFSNPYYLKIDGRPVVYLWNTWQYKGNVAGAVKEARARSAARGFDVFITGDEVQTQAFHAAHAALWDANTAFNFIIAGVPLQADVEQQAQLTDKAFKQWRSWIKGLKVAGRRDFVNFEPGLTPQFDNRLFADSDPIYVPARSKDQVAAMAAVARDNSEPVGKSGQRLVWINTWNDWAETTTIEPTVDLGPKYPAGNYGFDMLEVVRDTFGPQTFPPDAVSQP